MYRNWEEHAAIEVAGARIGSVVSFVESSQPGPVQGLHTVPRLTVTSQGRLGSAPQPVPGPGLRISSSD